MRKLQLPVRVVEFKGSKNTQKKMKIVVFAALWVNEGHPLTKHERKL